MVIFPCLKYKDTASGSSLGRCSPSMFPFDFKYEDLDFLNDFSS